MTKGTDPAVRKKAALCFLRFFREHPGNLVHSEWAEKMVRCVVDGGGGFGRGIVDTEGEGSGGDEEGERVLVLLMFVMLAVMVVGVVS